MSRGTITYHLSRPNPDTLRMTAKDGFATIIRDADLHLPGRRPSDVANALDGCVQRHLLKSRAAIVTADWPVELRVDAPLWQRFRDVVAQMPRGPD